MNEGQDSTHRLTRRSVIGGSAALGIVAAGAPAALAETTRAPRQDRTDRAGGTAEAGNAGDAPDAGDAGQVWGFSASGLGAGVRGNGHVGVAGEGTHVGVTGDGFIGVRGTTSGLADGEPGVGVLAQAQTEGGLALRADGPSRFSGPADFGEVTAFARSGTVTVRAGSASATRTGVALEDGTVILATLQGREPGVQLHAVRTDPAAGSFTIFLTAAPRADLRIGWLAIG